MIKYLIYFIIFLTYSSSLFAYKYEDSKKGNVISEKIRLSKLKSSDELIALDHYINLSWNYRNYNPDSSLHYADLSIKISEKYKNDSIKAKAINIKGTTLYYLDRYEEANKLQDESIKIRRRIKDYNGLRACNLSKALNYLQLGKYDSAYIQINLAADNLKLLYENNHLEGERILKLMDSLDDAYSSVELISDKENLERREDAIKLIQNFWILQNRLAEILVETYRIEEAYRISDEMSKTKRDKNDHEMVSVYFNFAKYYYSKNLFSKSQYNISRALPLAVNNNDDYEYLELMLFQSKIDLKLCKYHEFLKNLNDTEEYFTFLKSKRGLIKTNYLRAEYYLQSNQVDKVLHFIDSIKAYVKSANEIKNIKLEAEGYELLSRMYENIGDSYQALVNLKKYNQLNKEIFLEILNSKNYESSRKVVLKYKDLNLKVREQIIKSKNEQLYYIAAISIFLILLLSVIFWQFRKSKRTNKIILDKNSEITTLLEELESKNLEIINTVESKERLLSLLSHDIRSPLQTLLSSSKYLSQELSSTITNSKLDILNNLHLSLLNLNIFVDNTLKWISVQKGEIEIRNVEFDLAELVYSAIEFHKENSKRKSLQIECSISSSTIYNDKMMIDSIIRNLLDNAIKYSKEESTIHLNFSNNDNSPKLSIINIASPKNIEFVCSKILDNSNEYNVSLGMKIIKDFCKKCNIKLTSKQIETNKLCIEIEF